MSSSASSAPDNDDVTAIQAASDGLEGGSDVDDDDSLPDLDESLPGLGDAPTRDLLGTSALSSKNVGNANGLGASMRLSSSDPDPIDCQASASVSSSLVSPRDSSLDTRKLKPVEVSTNSNDSLGEGGLATIVEKCVVHMPEYDSSSRTHARSAADVRQSDIIRRRQEEAALRLREKEDELWDNLPLGDVEKLRGMLQVVSLYQQQLRENEGIIDDLHMRIESDDRTHRGLRRRFQQSQHGVIVVEEQEASLQQEHEQWARKGERYAIDDDIEALRLEHHNFQQELQALLAEAGPARNSLLDVQTRLKNSLEKQDHQRSALSEYEETCKNTLETMKVEHGAYCKDLRQAETSRLRSALANAQVHIRHLAKENQEVFEDLSNQRQEGARLQQQCAESREKVLELAAQVRAYLDEPRVAAQLGASLDGSMASMSFLPFLGDDPYHDVELESLRRQCKALERECQRTNDALERKQMECERWRARYLETRSRGPRSNFEVLHENHALGEAPAPFVLGPEPGTAEENLLLTPRF